MQPPIGSPYGTPPGVVDTPALQTEVAAYLEVHAADRDGDGHALVVRNGKARTRHVTGRVRNDRRERSPGRRQRPAVQVHELHPPAVHASLPEGRRGELLGKDAASMSATNIARLTNEGEDE